MKIDYATVKSGLVLSFFFYFFTNFFLSLLSSYIFKKTLNSTPPFFLVCVCVFERATANSFIFSIRFERVALRKTPSRAKRKNENRRGRIDDQESQSGHAHAHQGNFLLLRPRFVLLCVSLASTMRTKVVGSMMRSIVIGDAFFFSLALAHASYFLFLRAKRVFAKRTTGSRGKRER